MKDLYLTKYEQVLKELENIWYRYTVSDGIMYGTLKEQDIRREYSKITENIDKIPGLTDIEKGKIIEEINSRLESVPQIEEKKAEERKAEENDRTKAFEDAKNRYKELNIFKKFRYLLRGEGPKNLDPEALTRRKIDEIYR